MAKIAFYLVRENTPAARLFLILAHVKRVDSSCVALIRLESNFLPLHKLPAHRARSGIACHSRPA